MGVEYIEVGRVCVSKAGRDKGRAFAIVAIADEQHFLLADGQLRKLVHPKKKKRKHVAIRPQTLDAIREKIISGAPLLDAEIRKALVSAGYVNGSQGKEGCFCPKTT